MNEQKSTPIPQLDRWRFDGITRVGRSKHLWGAPGIAAAIGCSESRVRRLAARPDVPITKPAGSGMLYADRDQLDAWLQGQA